MADKREMTREGLHNMKIYDESKGGAVSPFVFPEYESDPHAVYSLTLREIVEDGYDVFGDPDWQRVAWPSDADPQSWLSQTRVRVQDKILRYYWNAEIEPRVPARWRFELTTRALMVVPKYATVYEAVAEGLSPLADSDRYGKNRRVFSDFPATQLDQETGDYASSADDYQYEDVQIGDVMSKMRQLRGYNDVDMQLVREFETCFSQLLTVTIGGM